MKLHIGCANRYFKGWTNLDINPGVADVIDDAKTLNSISDNSCDIIYAAHVLEHFGRYQVLDVLKIWFRKLKVNGVLRLSVPDFAKVVYMYQKGTSLDTQLLGYITGGQRDQFDYHKMMFDRQNITRLLKEAGFTKIRLWDWRKTEHSHYDDYSQAYLPHMDKENGTMMSLNIEAVKQANAETGYR